MSGAKERLSISRVNTKTGLVETSPEFSAMLNPGKYTRTSAIAYTAQERPPQNPDRQPRLDQHALDKLDLDELVFDGTGVIDPPPGMSGVDEQINLLKVVLNDPAGDENVVNAVVEIIWGSLVFRGRVTSMAVNYTLFAPSGMPLRARVKLSFVAYDQSGPAQIVAGPPQARQVRLVDGDTLPLICAMVYNDPSMCAAVALINGLTTLRQVLPGALLNLPAGL